MLKGFIRAAESRDFSSILDETVQKNEASVTPGTEFNKKSLVESIKTWALPVSQTLQCWERCLILVDDLSKFR